MQNVEESLIVGGEAHEYARDQTTRGQARNYRRIFFIIVTIVQLFIFASVLYYFLIKPILTTKQRNEKYLQPTVMTENERKIAEKRYEQILQTKDIEACNEFKNKEYRNPKEMEGGRTSYYYTCIYNLSIDLKNYQTCLSLQDDYSKRICLQGLATVFKNPKYCQEADSYAKEEVAKEEFSQAETDRCYQNIRACSFIEDIDNKEGCLLFSAQSENVLDISLCRSFTDSKRKEQCLETVAVLENNPQYCQESKDQDYCYWSAVKITAPNLGKENDIIKEEWCKKIKKNSLKTSCFSSN